MPLVVADTSPLRYLCQIGQIDLLPQLFQSLLIPGEVYKELQQASTPQAVRDWILIPPNWLTVVAVTIPPEFNFLNLDAGERAALALSQSIGAKILLIDDRKGAKAASSVGLQVTGTLGILALAAQRGLIHLPNTLERLRETNFRYRPEMIDALLNRQNRE